jgi:LDH2 family malate/lactate/ureidoglycolate dehydrogenase
MSTDRRFAAAALRDFTAQLFRNAGLGADEAGCLAESLVLANLRGVDSHGLMRLRTYATRVRRGVVRGGATPLIVRESPAFLAVDGANGNGMWIGRQVMELCLGRARETGACFATVCHGNHFGIAAFFTEMAARAGMVGLAMSNAGPTMVPTGAASRCWERIRSRSRFRPASFPRSCSTWRRARSPKGRSSSPPRRESRRSRPIGRSTRKAIRRRIRSSR